MDIVQIVYILTTKKTITIIHILQSNLFFNVFLASFKPIIFTTSRRHLTRVLYPV